MTRVRFVVGGWLLALCIASAGAQVPESEVPVKELGDGRYQVGRIIVDKPARSFSVEAKLIHTEDPLEYLAVARRGVKDYESLLELRTRGLHFNIACILIGLDDAGVVRPKFQFDETVVEGPEVSIKIRWEGDDGSVEIDAADALRIVGAPDGPPRETRWIYTGSVMYPSDPPTYLADSSGSLIGFVHDPMTVIEHQLGLGIGAYGSILGNTDILPPIGTRMTLIVTALPDPPGGGDSESE
ncbi:MAG: YdjY domain-containing protein [Chromatiales bacterium]|jgi:hypothetical protein